MKKAATKTPRIKIASRPSGAAELDELRLRLQEAEETIEALRSGSVDAVVVNPGLNGLHQIYSLSGADQPYRVYVERMQEGAVTVSAEGVILFSNLRFADMLGLPLQRVIGSSLALHLAPDAWRRIAQVFKDKDNVVKHASEIRAMHPAIPLSVLLTASVLPLEGQEVMCLVVTDLRAQEENVRLRTAKDVAESASLAKDQFFAALSHELRTPLTPVLMTLAALETDPTLPADVHEDILMMKRNIELEAKLVDDLLDLNRIATGKLKLDLHSVDLNAAVHQVCSICRSQDGNEDVVFDLRLDESVGMVGADPSRLQQVLWNVLKNAIKFTLERGAVTISTRKLPSGACEVRVKDQGIGIPEQALPHIFNAFEQGGAGITRQFGGLGLGLAISKAIMELHHGSIRAESAGAGHGATFIMEFPVQEVSAAGVRPMVPDEKARSQKVRLLLVEDHADTLRTLGRLLTNAGYEVQGAVSVAAAMKLVASGKFDVVVSDLGLPDGDGYELMRRISALRDVPAIAMSGYGMEEDVQRSLAAGFSEHLTKPVQLSALKRAIARLAPSASVATAS